MSAGARARTPAEEEYLQIIYWLMEAELPITGANIARAMQLSPPTVHEMLGRLEQDGYVTRNEDKSLRFTESGLEQAEAIVGRHRLIERFLTDVVGIAWDDVHEEAEKLEHAMSPAFEQWMISAVGDAKTCPHGHPIEPGNRVPGVPLADVEVGARGRGPAVRERGRGPAPLPEGRRACTPGLKGTLAESSGDEVVLQANGDVRVGHAQRRRDGLGARRPVTAAAHRAARAAGARQRPLRPLGR